jgi:mRNA interferase HigB
LPKRRSSGRPEAVACAQIGRITALAALDAWFDEVKKARWSSAADVKRSYATASIVSADRIVFNIKGNDYRLVVATDFDKGIVWIKWIGTHKDYDKIDVKEVRHGG